jgi:hypothetical protein
MKKLSNIDESFWGDVHRRSRGDEIRKEDDINNYNLDAFYDYLNDHYWCNAAGHRIKKYPETSMSELAEIISLETDYKITKSGINHHFRKIKELVRIQKEKE